MVKTFQVTMAIVMMFMFLGCGNNTDNSKQVKQNNVSVNEMSKRRLTLYSEGQTTATIVQEKDFFISPLTNYATLGNRLDESESNINDDGHNYIVVPNVFETYLSTMKLNFIYNSDDSKDNFNKIFGAWRTSFTSYIDFSMDYDNAYIKSKLYDTPQDACEQGFYDIKDTLHRGILQSAHVSYDNLNSVCTVYNATQKVGEFHIFSKTYGIVGNYHYITKPSGQTLVFEKQDDTTYIADDRGVVVSLTLNEDGTYEYIDADGFKNTYNKDGKLIEINNEGQITTIHYDNKYKITEVQGPLDTNLTFNYDALEKLVSVDFGDKEALFSYDEENQLNGISVKTDEYKIEDDNSTASVELTYEDDNETIQKTKQVEESLDKYKLVSFSYNDKHLLSNFITHEIKDENGTVIVPSRDTTYLYDDLNRIIKVADNVGSYTVEYSPNKVVKTDSQGEEIVHNISYMNSKQQVTLVDTVNSTLDSTYNEQAQLSSINLNEEPDVDQNGTIVTQGLTNGKKLFQAQFTYNPKGLINNIQYSSIESGKKFVKLDYKSRYPKPTKILTQDDVSFFDYNDEGQLIKKTSLVFDKEMKLKAESVTYDDVIASKDKEVLNYEYDKNGFIHAVKDITNNTTTTYATDANGKVKKQARLKGQWFWFNTLWFQAYINASKEGWTPDTGDIHVTDSDVQVAFVGGANESKDDLEGYTKWKAELGSKCNFYLWDQVDPWYNGFNHHVLDNKSQSKLITIGHSWGGDSAVKAEGDTDLLITVDPVGRAGHFYDPNAYWIELYAMAGTPYGGYLKAEWLYKTISFDFFTCSCHWFSCSCGWRRNTIRVRYPALVWHSTMQWNDDDWIAFAGGKGWYGGYDPGEPHADQFIKMTAHHGDFGYMLWKMEQGTGRKLNNNFGLSKVRFGNSQPLSYINDQAARDRMEKVYKNDLF